MTGGHRLVDHTADVIIEAWGRTRVECLEHAGLALTEIFASTRDAAPTTTAPLDLTSDDPEDLLVGLLEELIFMAEVDGLVVLGLHLQEGPGGRISGRVDAAPAAEVELVGPVPKGISREDLVLRREGATWRARAVVDV